jgi:MFS family permease
LVYIVSIMTTSICTKYYQFMLAQGVLSGISNGMVMCPTMAAAPQYFNKKRAAAMGLGIAGSSLGGVVFPIAMSKMLVHTHLGFSWTIRVIGFIILALLLPASVAIKARLPPRKKKFFLPSAFQEPVYVSLIVAGFFGFLGMLTPLFYLPAYALERGMSPGLAFYLAAIFNGASFPGRVIPGILADKLGRFNMFIAATVSSGILTFCWQRVKGNAAILAFTAIFGFCAGAIVSGMVVSFASVPKDPQNIGTYMGMGMAISAVAALVGPPINGALLSHDYEFDGLSTFSGAMCLAAAFFVVIAKYFTGNGLLSKS